MPNVNFSVIVITYNEAQNISDVLESARFADEIIVVDGFSSDNTVEIARQYTNKIYNRTFDDFSAQKNFAIGLASHEWIMVLDADEIITPLLREEITEAVKHTPDCAYSIGRDNIFMGRKMRFSGMQNDRVVRLFPKTVRYQSMRVHEVPETGTLPIKRLQGRLTHLTYKNYEDMLRKVDHYSTLKARDMYEAGYKATFAKMLFKPFHRFLRHYILQGGFMDGKQGYIIGWIRALELFQRITKTWRMQSGDKEFF